MASVKKNILLNGINTLSGLLFPMVTFPYAARVLMPEGIGTINFLSSIVSYIVLFTSLGIPMYAVREVAKYRDDKARRDQITMEILILSLLLCLLGYVAVWALAEFVPQINRQASLFYVLSLIIVLDAVGVNLFYMGIENFAFITLRTLLIRVLCAASLFIFVRHSGDLLAYAFVTVGTNVGNNLLNVINLRRHIGYGLIDWGKLDIMRHLKPAFQVFVLNLISSLFVQLNDVMLGFMSGETEVGYYTAGYKVVYIGSVAITSMSAVMLPRCSNLLQKGDRQGFASVIGKSLTLNMALSLPIAVGLMALSLPVTMVLCGPDFTPSVAVLFLSAPSIVFISLSNLMSVQVLYPMDKVRIAMAGLAGGALVNPLLNLWLIPRYGAAGAALSALVAQMVVFMIQLLAGRCCYPFRVRELLMPRYLIAAALMGAAVWALTLLRLPVGLTLTGGILLGVAVYGALLLLQRDPLATTILRTLRHR